MSCFVQDGASYHESPISTSGLPSLLTSPTATPSERNLPSMVVFFQVTGGPSSAPAVSVVESQTADQPKTAIVRMHTPMLIVPVESLGQATPTVEIGGEFTEHTRGRGRTPPS